ncbi:MAG TPA: helix-turn-helix transcriptional regulator [Solirubrobacterales bacterium]|nr:helix-turn-helix transcriptional regulator [Solirubrobacterales bacterium]
MPGGSPPPAGRRGLALALHQLRSKAGLSQDALAERADLPPLTIAGIESGTCDPTWGDMRRVAAALGVTLEALSELAEQYELEREV